MKKKEVISFVIVLIVFIVIMLIPFLYSLSTNFFSYFVTYKEYFKFMVPAIFTCAAIISTWLLSKYQNERDIQKKQQETLENNRPKFLFKNYLNTDLIATANEENSYLKNLFLVGINDNERFFNLLIEPYIFIKDIFVPNVVFKDFIVYYITSENERIVCLYQNDTFTYFNVKEQSTSGNELVKKFLDRVNQFPIIDQYDYNSNDVLLADMKSIVDNVKLNRINKACLLLLNFIRIYRNELSQKFIVEKLEIIRFIFITNKYECKKYLNTKYFKDNLHYSRTANFNKAQIIYLQTTKEIDIEFMLRYLSDIISELNNHDIQKLDDFILRNVEIYIQDSTEKFAIDYETKKNLVNFESVGI